MNRAMIFDWTNQRTVEAQLLNCIHFEFQQMYGTSPRPLIAQRLQEELHALDCSETVCDVAALYEFTQWLKSEGYSFRMGGAAGASLILYVLGITRCNPLPPHDRCPKCKQVWLLKMYRDSADAVPDGICVDDWERCTLDGHDIPWQTLWGYSYFSKTYTVHLPMSVYQEVSNFLMDCLHYFCAEPMQRKENDSLYIDLNHICLRFDLGEATPAKPVVGKPQTERYLSYWQTRVDPSIASQFPKPKTASDVLCLLGLLRSAGAWDEDAKKQITENGLSISDLIVFREDIFFYLRQHGFLDKDSWRGMEHVRKGLGLHIITDEMKCAEDSWKLERISRISFLPGKADIMEQLLYEIKGPGQQ